MQPLNSISRAWEGLRRGLLPGLRRLASESLDLLAPGFCRQCDGPVGRAEDPFCARCLARIRWVGSACARCGLPIVQPARAIAGAAGPAGADALPPRCGACSGARLRFDWASAGGVYEGPLRTAILSYKFQGDFGVLPLLGQAMARAGRAPSIETALQEAEAIVPVPLHPLKRWWRGRDSCLVLARELSAELSSSPRAPCVVQLLRKRRWTPPQSRLEAVRRRRNPRNAFVVRPGLVVPSVVILVDDVLTTGATASECARALKRGGARRVIVVAAARSE